MSQPQTGNTAEGQTDKSREAPATPEVTKTWETPAALVVNGHIIADKSFGAGDLKGE